MAEVGKEELQKLADIIVLKIKEEFQVKHLSKNLINTIKITNEGNQIQIEIPAQTYNMLLYQTKGVIVHTSHGSYASKLDLEGSSFMIYRTDSRKKSFRVNPRNHIGYIDRAINSAISEWRSTLGDKVKKVEG